MLNILNNNFLVQKSQFEVIAGRLQREFTSWNRADFLISISPYSFYFNYLFYFISLFIAHPSRENGTISGLAMANVKASCILRNSLPA